MATLDPAALGSGVTLSNGNLTAEQTGAGGANNTLATAHHASGKYYYEFTVNASLDNTQIGIANAATARSEYLGEISGHSIGNYAAGGSWLGAGGTTSAPFLINGQSYGVAIDLDNKKAWSKLVSMAGDWNRDASADPATGVNGATFASISGEVYPAISLNDPGDKVTFNFGSLAYLGTPPSGFADWEAGAISGQLAVIELADISALTGHILAGVLSADEVADLAAISSDFTAPAAVMPRMPYPTPNDYGWKKYPPLRLRR
jgi:hypothetical protein